MLADFRNAEAARRRQFAGQKIVDLVTVNGVRVVAEDGTWGLVRASSNKPELVVVVEARCRASGGARCSRRSMRFCGAIRKSAPYNQTFWGQRA